EGSGRIILLRGERRRIFQGNCRDDRPLSWARRQDSQRERRGSGAEIRRCWSLRHYLQQLSTCGQRAAARLVSPSTFSYRIFREPRLTLRFLRLMGMGAQTRERPNGFGRWRGNRNDRKHQLPAQVKKKENIAK